MQRSQFRLPLGGFALLALAIAMTSPSAGVASAAEPTSVRSEQGVVVAVSHPACAVGAETLARGGNAVDAAVATALALAVTYPEAGNLAGGGFMVVKPADERETVVIDYRETAPAGVTAKALALDPSATNHRLVGTPGTLRGLALAHRQFGRLPWMDVVAPARQLAQEGFELDDATAQSLNRGLLSPGGQAEFYRVYRRPDGGEWRAGLRLSQPDLAASLAIIADEGAEALYSGSLAPKLLAEITAGEGLITAQDLTNYTAKIRDPIHGIYRGYEVYTAPPPCAGGTALVEMLNIVESFDLPVFDRWSPFTLHLTAEAMRRANDDAAKYLGDPDFDSIPLHLTSKQFARRITERIDPGHPTTARPSNVPFQLPESTGATHFAVVDATGMAVSNVYGLEQPFGVSIVAPGTGILLNGALLAFRESTDRVRRNENSERRNELAPGKRMLSPLAPAIVCRDGKLALVVGAASGSASAGVALTLMTNMLDFQMDPASALDAPRWRPRSPGQVLEFEGYSQEAYAGAVRGLHFMGYKLQKNSTSLGDAQAIRVRDGVYFGAADRRIAGAAATPEIGRERAAR